MANADVEEGHTGNCQKFIKGQELVVIWSQKQQQQQKLLFDSENERFCYGISFLPSFPPIFLFSTQPFSSDWKPVSNFLKALKEDLSWLQPMVLPHLSVVSTAFFE